MPPPPMALSTNAVLLLLRSRGFRLSLSRLHHLLRLGRVDKPRLCVSRTFVWTEADIAQAERRLIALDGPPRRPAAPMTGRV